MQIRRVVLAVAAFVAVASARVVPGPESDGESLAARQTLGLQPCGRVGNAQAQGQTELPPSLALACLNSVPLDVRRDMSLIDYMYPLIAFESNLAFIKNPPAAYKAASGKDGVDILASLLDIRRKVQNNEYKSQYEFTTALELLVLKAGDSHFSLGPALNKAFMFARDIVVVSVSDDGISLPKLYDIADLYDAIDGGYKPSPIVKIDGIDVLDFMTELAKVTPTHDLDAGWNMALPSKAKSATGFTIGDYISAGGYFTLNDTTKLELSNGTVLTFPNHAVPRGDFRGINTGQEMHQAAELQPGERAKKRDLLKRQAPGRPITQRPLCNVPHGNVPRPPDWPEAFDEHQDKYAGGYFLSGAGYEDTAVLEVNSFVSIDPNIQRGGDACAIADMYEYHRFIKSFVRQFKAANKTRLVIDLSNNGGGYEATLADTFDQLFPGEVPGFHYRARATQALDWLTNATFTGRTSEPLGVALFDDLHSRWRDVFGPEIIASDNFTRTIFRDTLGERASFGLGDVVYKTPLVAPENIVLITDGDCHSSCAFLTGWLMREKGVRAVALGGRPTEAPMQAIGGTKGGAPYPWDIYQAVMDLGISIMGRRLAPPAGIGLPSLNLSPIRVFDKMINSMDIWHNSSNVPVHFNYEAAHCRLFYTPETLINMEAMWKAVVNVAWKGAKCVAGSTANADNTISAKAPAFKAATLARAVPVASADEKRSVAAKMVPVSSRPLSRRPVDKWNAMKMRDDLRWDRWDRLDDDGFWARDGPAMAL